MAVMMTGPSLIDTEAELKRRMPSGAMHYGVAVDGSDMSKRAMAAGLLLNNTKRGDKISVLHISDSSKDYLQKHLTPQHLKNQYEALTSAARVPSTWLCREKGGGQSTCTALTKMADKAAVDLLLIGSWGRKGEKLDFLGSVSDFSLRESHASICILRSTGTKWTTSCKYLFATDGSHASAVAFCQLVTLLMKPADTVSVVIVTSGDGMNELQIVQQYKEYMTAHMLPTAVVVRLVDLSKSSITNGILAASVENCCDALVLGVGGCGRKKLGSVSEDICTRANCTTIILKDSYEVMADHYKTAGARTLMHDIKA
ncbi:MAG: hypothetical protein WDW38_001367 [Sanguina aurantia]